MRSALYPRRPRRVLRRERTLRRQVLGAPGVQLMYSALRRHVDPRLPWRYKVDLLMFHGACLVNCRWWRGDLVELQVVAGNPGFMPPALAHRVDELHSIRLISARMREARHAA